MSFEMVRTKKIYCKNVFVLSLTDFITLQRLFNYVDMIQSMMVSFVDTIICYVSKIT